MTSNKPYVSAAFVCEKILRESDGAISAIRIVDTFYVPTDAPPPDVNAGILITAFVSLKSDSPMEGAVSVALKTPDGETKDMPQKWPISFSEEISGANLILNFAIHPRHIGTSWIDVRWNNEVITRAPLRIVRGEKPNSLTSESP